MTLEDYITIRKEELKQFEESWKVNNIKDPKMYPIELPEAEWNEQERLLQEYGE